MKRSAILTFLAAAVLLLMACPLMADDITLSGVLSFDGQVNLHSIYVSQNELVTFTTSPGPFDAALSIFNGSGNHLITNDDSPSDGINTIPKITIYLTAGYYTVAVSACCSFANAADMGTDVEPTDGYNLGNYWIGGYGTLANGFSEYSCEGTCDGPYQLPVQSGSADTSITDLGETSVTATPVPEAGTGTLLSAGLITALGLSAKSHCRSIG